VSGDDAGWSPEQLSPPDWVSFAERVRWIVWVGWKLGLERSATLRMVQPLLVDLRRYASNWRLAFDGGTWLKRRRGDGRLYGDPDGGFGHLSGKIEWETWRVSLDWVGQWYRDGQIGDPYEFAHLYLGLRLPQGGHELRRFPHSAWLQLRLNSIEETMGWLVAVQQQAAPSEPRPVHIQSMSPELRELWHPPQGTSAAKTAAAKRRGVKKSLLPDVIHPIIEKKIKEALPEVITRDDARAAVYTDRPEARQQDIDACFMDKRYDPPRAPAVSERRWLRQSLEFARKV
jgi:hypothetical protein